MGSGKWIGGFLGWVTGGPIGALLGYFIGSAVDKFIDVTRQLPGSGSGGNFGGGYGTGQGGYGGGYGNYVIISHGNGVQTLYGHCTTLNVSVGQKVSQGQQIATVGSTGNSTGNHLHLEIRVNGIAQNPQNYLY